MMKKTNCSRILTLHHAHNALIKNIREEVPDRELVVDELPTLSYAFPKLGTEVEADPFVPYPGPASRPDLDSPAIYFHSSGSTGFPKPIAHSHKFQASWLVQRQSRSVLAFSLLLIPHMTPSFYAILREFTRLQSNWCDGTTSFPRLRCGSSTLSSACFSRCSRCISTTRGDQSARCPCHTIEWKYAGLRTTDRMQGIDDGPDVLGTVGGRPGEWGRVEEVRSRCEWHPCALIGPEHDWTHCRHIQGAPCRKRLEIIYVRLGWRWVRFMEAPSSVVPRSFE